MTKPLSTLLAAAAASAALLAAGCGEERAQAGRGFTTNIDNPYWPLRPGSRWVYSETGEGPAMKVAVTVTPKTKRMANGVTARVVRDEVTEHGKPVELTDDFYAQDRAGNVWYLGEATAEYENGKVKTREGSFEAGRNGAKAGIIMPAHPRPGMGYREEFLRGHAEDQARVLSTDDQAQVPAGHFANALLVRDSTPLEPRVLEYKLYARGVGQVAALSPSGAGTERLVSYRRGR
jgi:hypothetical protein